MTQIGEFNGFRTIMFRLLITFAIVWLWYILFTLITFDFLTTFTYFTNNLTNQGTNIYDWYSFWNWTVLFIIIFVGFFWSIGVFGWIF